MPPKSHRSSHFFKRSQILFNIRVAGGSRIKELLQGGATCRVAMHRRRENKGRINPTVEALAVSSGKEAGAKGLWGCGRRCLWRLGTAGLGQGRLAPSPSSFLCVHSPSCLLDAVSILTSLHLLGGAALPQRHYLSNSVMSQLLPWGKGTPEQPSKDSAPTPSFPARKQQGKLEVLTSQSHRQASARFSLWERRGHGMNSTERGRWRT